MANNKNLIPITSGAQAREMGKKGGSVKSEKKKIASRFRELKKKGVNDETLKHLSSMVESREYYALDVLTTLESMKNKIYTVDEAIKHSNGKIQLGKFIHGDKPLEPEETLEEKNCTYIVRIIGRDVPHKRWFDAIRKTLKGLVSKEQEKDLMYRVLDNYEDLLNFELQPYEQDNHDIEEFKKLKQYVEEFFCKF